MVKLWKNAATKTYPIDETFDSWNNFINSKIWGDKDLRQFKILYYHWGLTPKSFRDKMYSDYKNGMITQEKYLRYISDVVYLMCRNRENKEVNNIFGIEISVKKKDESKIKKFIKKYLISFPIVNNKKEKKINKTINKAKELVTKILFNDKIRLHVSKDLLLTIIKYC